MQARWRLPSPVPHAGDKLTDVAGWMQRHAPAIARHNVPAVDHAAYLHLHSFHRRIHITNRAARARFFAEHVPGFESLPELEMNISRRDFTKLRKPEFKM